ncbi:hypothetical protein LTR37_006334 [Vermiconidia calcicola]|uniref:Uncharacterized protein n=1 Tax=Vermiconidia calcicola TaxID=1690605 RepID=A0ACC3NHZ8_9PEZI|nr:hypothetical protein LTR37_006334 [Vermiconidia calcicola]
MVQAPSLAWTAASLLLLPPALANGLYSKSSPVLQVSGSNYDSLIAKSNHTPAYEKAAKSLRGLAKVAAVNCDEESNKPFCGSMGVQGFPTLKIVKPGKKAGKPIVEDYQGARSAKGIVDAVIDKIPNHVKRLKDDDYQDWLEEGDGPKAILFSDKGTTSALLKAIAIDFLGGISVAQIRDKEREAMEVFHVEKMPTLVLLPGGGKDPVTYNSEMKKDAMVAFLSQAASPNPDPAPKKAKASSSSKSDKNKASKASASFSKASESHASSEAKTAKASQTMETMDDASQPSESPDANVVTEDTQKPIKVPDVAPPIQTLPDVTALQHKCLNTKAGTCILALLPEETEPSPNTLQAISSLSELHHKHETANRNLFPFFQLPSSNGQAEVLRQSLKLGSGVELIAMNGKRAWYRHYPKSTFGRAEVEDWIDGIRMGEGSKEKIPEGLILEAGELPPEPVHIQSGDPASMKEQLKKQVPEGVDFEFEELDESVYESIIAQASAEAKTREAGEQKAEQSESATKKEEEPIEHIEL